MRMLILSLLVVGCVQEEVISLQGVLLDGPSANATALEGAELAVREGDGSKYSESTSGSEGRFQIDAPGGQNVFLEVAGEGLVTSSFTGVAGLGDTQEIEEGLVFGFRASELDEWRAAFDGCPGSDGSAAAVVGEIRLFGFEDPDSGEEPLITTGFAAVETRDGDVFEACYLDKDGLLYDPEATSTGGSGRYAIFDLPEGVHTLKIGYEAAPGVVGEFDYFLWLPSNGLSPRFPSYVELVF